MNDLDLCNNALMRLGASKIAVLDDSTEVGGLCTAIYKAKTESLLCIFPWNFTKVLATLTATEVMTSIKEKWPFVVVVFPVELLYPGLLAIYDKDFTLLKPGTHGDYEVMGNKIYMGIETCYILYQKNPSVTLWPSFFCELVINALMVDLMFPIMGDFSERKVLYAEVYGTPSQNGLGGMLGTYMAMDSKIQGTDSFPSHFLDIVRR